MSVTALIAVLTITSTLFSMVGVVGEHNETMQRVAEMLTEISSEENSLPTSTSTGSSPSSSNYSAAENDISVHSPTTMVNPSDDMNHETGSTTTSHLISRRNHFLIAAITFILLSAMTPAVVAIIFIYADISLAIFLIPFVIVAGGCGLHFITTLPTSSVTSTTSTTLPISKAIFAIILAGGSALAHIVTIVISSVGTMRLDVHSLAIITSSSVTATTIPSSPYILVPMTLQAVSAMMFVAAAITQIVKLRRLVMAISSRKGKQVATTNTTPSSHDDNVDGDQREAVVAGNDDDQNGETRPLLQRDGGGGAVARHSSSSSSVVGKYLSPANLMLVGLVNKGMGRRESDGIESKGVLILIHLSLSPQYLTTCLLPLMICLDWLGISNSEFTYLTTLILLLLLTALRLASNKKGDTLRPSVLALAMLLNAAILAGQVFAVDATVDYQIYVAYIVDGTAQFNVLAQLMLLFST